MTARVWRPFVAVLRSVKQEQEVVRKMRKASEEPSKRRRLSGKDSDAREAFEDAEAATGDAVTATSSGDCISRESPCAKNII